MEAFVMVVRVVTYTIIEGFPHPITPFTTSRGSTPSVPLVSSERLNTDGGSVLASAERGKVAETP